MDRIDLAYFIRHEDRSLRSKPLDQRQDYRGLCNTPLLEQLIKHKLQTKPTLETIPPAIEAKLFHKDRAFFRTFTRRHDTRPTHKRQFVTLLNNATEKFRKQNEAYVINKINWDQIFDLLRKKLAIDFWTNEEFTNLDPYEIARYTLYLAGFAKIKICLEFKALRKLIANIKTNLLQKLPDTPDGIDKQLKDALPFSLPLEDRRQIRAVAITLH